MALDPVSIHTPQQLAPFLVCIISLFLATTAVVLRVLAHRIKKANLGSDDYSIFLALFFAWVNFVCVIIATAYGGLGLHMQDLDDPRRHVILLKCRMPIFILWHSTLSLVKISLLLLYLRIFATKGRKWTQLSPFQIAAYSGIAIVALFFCAVIFEETLLCRPIAVNWNLNIKNFKCGNGNIAYILTGVINIVTDVWVIILPIHQLWKLQIPFRSKIVLSFLFSCGLFIVVITIIRISVSSFFAWTGEDPTYTIWKMILWSQLEPNLAMFCACVPLLRPVLSNVIASYRSKYGSGSKRLQPDSTNKVDPAHGIRRQTYTEIHSYKSSGSPSDEAIPPQGYEFTVMSTGGPNEHNEADSMLGQFGKKTMVPRNLRKQQVPGHNAGYSV